MAIAPGTRVGPYEVTTLLGAGGMGEVYKARDTRLARTVAIKVSQEQFSERFSREAQAIATLNHPHICTLHDVGPDYLVMEFVDGVPLTGPLPMTDALRYAEQIADALDHAHRRGVVHRDLKPANILVTKSGIKLLDFGLAKQESPIQVDEATRTIGITQAGTITGTLQYMSPEQVDGRETDARSDIFSLGAVLYEMVTGKKAFDGTSAASVLAAVMKDEPQTPPELIGPLEPILRRCLAKDPDERWQSAADLKWAVRHVRPIAEPSATAASRSRLTVAAWSTAAALAVALAVVTWTLWPTSAPELHSQRFSISSPPDSEFTFVFPGAAISPDGTLLVFTAQRGQQSTLWLRPLNSLDARQLPGTETGNFPFWSPDGRSIAFYSTAERMLKRVDTVGGTPQSLCEAQSFEGGTWSRQGVILYSTGFGIRQVPAAGGSCSAVTSADAPSGERHTWPQYLPDGRTFLFVIRSRDSQLEGVYASSIDRPDQRTKLVSSDTKALYAPPYQGRTGYLLWLRDRTLVAQRFNAENLKLQGDPIPLAQNIAVGGGTALNIPASRAAFWASDSGLLVYRAGTGTGRPLVWFDREGKRLETLLSEERDGEIVNLRFSPDRTRLAVDRTVNDNTDVWIYEIGIHRWNKVTSSPSPETAPVWSHDSQYLAYASDRDGSRQIYRTDANGSGLEQRLTDGPNPKLPADWSQDGRYLLYAEQHPQTGSDLWILPLADGGETPGKPIPFVTTSENETAARFSPDGKWITFVSSTARGARAYIRAFPGGPPGQWALSNDNAANPTWHANGRELYYRAPRAAGGGGVFAAPIQFLPDHPVIGVPQELFRTVFGGGTVTADGQRFLMFTRPGDDREGDRNPLTVIVNWPAALD
jgi:serine/threonine protein kinase